MDGARTYGRALRFSWFYLRVPEAPTKAQGGKEWVGGKGLLVHVWSYHLWPLSQWGQGLNRALLVSEAALEAAPEASSHTICPSAYFFNRKKKEVYETDSGLLLL